ncbi:GGDEF domain-containing protein [Parvibaculum sp.]|jgi:diguanylate cyclase|uniref:GGDEF domain-containing protein n=1 Tax=Parvibaculum sp. TaxID=2024848 RepID=UPI000C59513C|nr:GGDEF domain-containing protein [Parvibaculum sp.]MAM96121.1 GGDEF domain-containing protein [Parvibaculum sp.]|tara:strand:+ start:9342 stop:10400 length:1059 start_codon:yes stop_codon:yes gene_type:complete
MMQAEDIEFATEWSERALQLMASNGVPPAPDNYSIWFRYASGRLPELNQEIDGRLARALPIDIDTTMSLQKKYFAEDKLTDVTLNTGTKLNTEVHQILKIIEESVGNSTALGTTVREASEGLTSQSSVSDVRYAVEAIVNASRSMEQRSAELEEHLRATKKELNELQENLEKARSEARTDGLTGLNNRKAFDEALTRELENAVQTGEPLCLAIGDIDHFKKFNDTFGHRTGDQVLRLVASCLKSRVHNGHIAARYGGEEFAVIMPATDVAAAETIATRVRETVQARELVKRSTGESLGRVTMSLGIAQFQHGDTAASIVERADACLYEAKRNGRNRVIVESRSEEMLQANAD